MHRHRNQPGDGGPWHCSTSRRLRFFFFFSSPFPLRVRRQTVSGREWVGSSCGDGALTGVGMEAADALMQVSWIVKGPPVGPTYSHPSHFFFFSRSSFSRSPDGGQVVRPCLSGRLMPPSPPPYPLGLRSYSTLTAAWLPRLPGPGTRSCHIILPFMSGTARSAVATLGPRTDESTGEESLSLSCESVSAWVCAARHLSVSLLPCSCPPAPPALSASSLQLLPACPPARLPLSDQSSSPTQTQPRPPTTTHHTHHAPALPCRNHPARTVPYHSLALPYHPIPSPSHPSLRPPSPCCTSLHMRCTTQL